jgi:hypothetical protein
MYILTHDISEYFAKDHRESLFPFLFKLASSSSSSQETLESLGEQILGSNSLLKFALTTRHYSPQVNLQLEKDSKAYDACFKQSTTTNGLLPFDYLSDACTSAAGQYTLLHVNMDCEEGRKNLLNYENKCFVFRHMAPANYREYVEASEFYMVRNNSLIDSLISVRGYGVELQIKDMEYKQQEVVEEQNQNGSGEAVEQDQDGVLFQTLTNRYPHLESDLQTFRDFLQKRSKSEDEEKIQVWQLSSIGLKALDSINSAASGSEKLDTLIDLAQNFPLHVSSLVSNNQTVVDSNVLKRQFESLKDHLEVADPARETIRRNTLFVNGRELDSNKLTVFSLYDILSSEQKVLSKFSNYMLDPSQIEKILYGSVGVRTEESKPRFLIDDEFEKNVIYYNDIESDSRYSGFPENLKTMLMPTMYGQLRFAKRNTFTAIYLLNPFSSPDAIEKLNVFMNFIYRGYPIRFGFILMPTAFSTINVGLSGTSTSVPSLQLDEQSAKYITHVESICRTNGAQACLQVLIQRNLNQGNSLSESDRHKLLERYELFAIKKGFGTRNSLFMNGVLYDVQDEMPDKLFMNAMKEEYNVVLDLIRQNKIKDSDKNLLQSIASNTNTFSRYNSLVFSDQAEYSIVDVLQYPNIAWRYSSILRESNDPYAKFSFIVCNPQDNESFLKVIDAYLESSKDSRIALLDTKENSDICGKLFSQKAVGGIIAPQGKKIVFDSLDQIQLFTSTDFDVLESQAVAKLSWLLNNDDWKSYNSYTSSTPVTNEYKSNVLFSISTLMASSRGERDNVHKRFENYDFKFSIKNEKSLQVDIVAIINPLSNFAQKWTSVLKYLAKLNYPVTIILNPEIDTSNMPLKSLYRFVLEEDKAVFELNQVNKIAGIYTLAMDTSETWLIESTYSHQDLDNLNLATDCTVGEGCYARFQLEHLVVTGSCLDVTEVRPPRGLQLELIPEYDDKKNKDVTLVMANYGYFQLKANTASIYSVQLPSKGIGRHSEIFSISKVSQSSFYEQQISYSIAGSQGVAPDDHIYVNSFDAPFVQVNVKRNPGKENEELLKDGEGDNDSGILSYFSGDKDKVVNVFSIASGHMYERLLKIMSLSVTKNTKRSKIKFWFLKQFLSPQFKKLLPELAKHFNFQYGLVSYAWPHWLHKQTQKQRIIWAYKVLFLDVLFPLREVKKIVFVDADQICRTDLTELYSDFNMKGNSLAYTPFCSDRREMDGFRFWDQGYWKQHLRGRPYHISALYVVDIALFRQKYHGDQFRMFYDSLSKDPNSLSNLDQDLPNYAQHVVPITSLPQQWLWCETWCSDQSKPQAKTIDLCNNPKTKEHKLTSARRIVPEWQSYDDEIKEFERTLISSTDRK